MDQNTPGLWDSVWQDVAAHVDGSLLLAQEACTIRWQRIERAIIARHGTLAGLRVIELGAGAGTNAALAARAGAHVTLVDYSAEALGLARRSFEQTQLQAEFLQHDILALPRSLLGKHDVSLSFGLAEHFRGAERVRVIRAHFDVLKEGGLAFISVPNRYNLPYRLFKFIAERTGRWRVGQENPFSRGELAAICREIGVNEYTFLGDSLWDSLRFLLPTRIKTRLGRMKQRLGLAGPRRQRGTPLDAYLSYALVLCGRK